LYRLVKAKLSHPPFLESLSYMDGPMPDPLSFFGWGWIPEAFFNSFYFDLVKYLIKSRVSSDIPGN
jgi:hypothetical protein